MLHSYIKLLVSSLVLVSLVSCSSSGSNPSPSAASGSVINDSVVGLWQRTLPGEEIQFVELEAFGGITWIEFLKSENCYFFASEALVPFTENTFVVAGANDEIPLEFMLEAHDEGLTYSTSDLFDFDMDGSTTDFLDELLLPVDGLSTSDLTRCADSD